MLIIDKGSHTVNTFIKKQLIILTQNYKIWEEHKKFYVLYYYNAMRKPYQVHKYAISFERL